MAKQATLIFRWEETNICKEREIVEEMINTNLKYTSTSLFSATGGLNIQSILVRNFMLDFRLQQIHSKRKLLSAQDLILQHNQND